MGLIKDRWLKSSINHEFELDRLLDRLRTLENLRRNGASLSVASLIDNFFAEIERMGGRRWDTSSLLARLER
jgi:3-hydroxyisobutyrate dehydrogenase-like beta-hydroxyacid dehydrogenase